MTITSEKQIAAAGPGLWKRYSRFKEYTMTGRAVQGQGFNGRFCWVETCCPDLTAFVWGAKRDLVLASAVWRFCPYCGARVCLGRN